MQRCFVLLGLALLAMVQPALASSPKAGSGKLKAEYERLLAEGCDPAAFHVQTPIDARVLRNVPYAKAGYTFQSKELSTVFLRDGGWYVPTTTEVKLPAADAACVAKLKRYEDTLRAATALDDSVIAWLTYSSELFEAFRTYGAGGRQLRFASGPRAIDTGSGCFAPDKQPLRWVWLDAACPSAQGECSGVLWECDQDCACRGGLAG